MYCLGRMLIAWSRWINILGMVNIWGWGGMTDMKTNNFGLIPVWISIENKLNKVNKRKK